MAARKGKSKRKKLRVADIHSGARTARAAGRAGDNHLIHVNDDELAQMHSAWGEPSTNPISGLPEYGIFSKLKKAVGFELWHGKKILKGLKASNIFGVDPIGTKIGNTVLGRHDKPVVDQLGGARSDRLSQYTAETGKDPGYAGALQGVAHYIAGAYAAGGAGNLAGAGASSMGATPALSQAAARLGSMAASRGINTANSPGFSSSDSSSPSSSSSSTGSSTLSGNAPTMTSNTKLPKGASYTSRDAWFTNAAQGALGRAQDLSTRPYTPYTGERVAGLSDNERQASQLAAGSTAQYQPMIDRLQGGFSSDGLSQYMNPYTDAVLGDRLRTIGNEFGRQSGDLDRNAAATDAFRTGRSDLARARLGLGRLRAESEATNEVKSDAFKNAQDAYFRQGSQDISGMGAISNANAQTAQSLSATGGTERSIRQGQNDFNYGQFLERRDWDMNNLNSLLSAIGAVNPAAGTISVGKKNSSSATDWGAVAGALGSIASEYYGSGNTGSAGGSSGGFGGYTQGAVDAGGG